jgi:hypothetical protein
MVAGTRGNPPHLLGPDALAAIRTAQPLLTIEALRQMPGVESGRLKRNVSRLLAQGKIQETSAGYVVVPA